MIASVARFYTPESIAQENNSRSVQVVKLNEEKRKHLKKRVAAYCRVSTDKDAQLESLDNQMESFRYQLALHDDWELVGIYADEGRSGTSVKGRPEFQRLIDDCKAGLIDYLMIKSISRFARNTLDCVSLVRELQGYGVQIYFEKEGIDTADITSEMLLVIMASFAQEESRSISENVKWGIRKRFESGKEMKVPVYGYRHTDDELYIVVPEEAEIVEEIFLRYVHGETPKTIVEDLQDRKVKPPAGDCWKLLQISRMLHNEKYVGDVVLQKHYVESHLTHKEVRNNGELPLFHIKNAHPAIIDRHLFVQTQQILEMRQVKTGNSSYPYGRMLKCPHCGKTLVHGSLYDVRFGGELLHNGGWGCYGEDGCGEYLLVQNVLDEVLIRACEKKYGERMEKVDFYWVDDTKEEIVLGDYTVEIHWRDGELTTEAMPLTHPELYPLASAMRYNAFLNKVRSGQRKVKSKFLMGL